MWMQGLQLLSHSVIDLQMIGTCGHSFAARRRPDNRLSLLSWRARFVWSCGGCGTAGGDIRSRPYPVRGTAARPVSFGVGHEP